MTEQSGIVLEDRRVLLELPMNAIDIELAQAVDGTFGVLYERQVNMTNATSATFFQRLSADYAPLGEEIFVSVLSSQRDTFGGGFADTGPDSAIALQPLADSGFFCSLDTLARRTDRGSRAQFCQPVWANHKR